MCSVSLCLTHLPQPFGRFGSNPSWQCTEKLHNTVLHFTDPLLSDSNHPISQDTSNIGPRIHIQSIQAATIYRHVLDLIPRIHGGQPTAPEASPFFDESGEQIDKETGESAQGNGLSYPEGYRSLKIPKAKDGTPRAFDIVVHVGVGFSGHIAFETIGNKRGYQRPDVRNELAPICIDQETCRGEKPQPSEAELREAQNIGVSDNEPRRTEFVLRGFGRGYESFEDQEQQNPRTISSLTEWLKEDCGWKVGQNILSAQNADALTFSTSVSLLTLENTCVTLL